MRDRSLPALVSLAFAALMFARCSYSQSRERSWFQDFLRYAQGDRASRAAQQWQAMQAEDGARCLASLRAAGVRFQALSGRATPDASGCGIPHPVLVTRGPTGVVYNAPLRVDCQMALEMVEVEREVQEAAVEHLGQRITRIDTLGTYSCRPTTGHSGNLSQHAFGNAIDLARFQPRRGQAAVVVRDYERERTDPTSARGRFLRALESRLRRLSGLSFVIGPRQNDAHRDHFHIDRALRWWHW